MKKIRFLTTRYNRQLEARNSSSTCIKDSYFNLAIKKLIQILEDGYKVSMNTHTLSITKFSLISISYNDGNEFNILLFTNSLKTNSVSSIRYSHKKKEFIPDINFYPDYFTLVITSISERLHGRDLNTCIVENKNGELYTSTKHIENDLVQPNIIMYHS